MWGLSLSIVVCIGIQHPPTTCPLLPPPCFNSCCSLLPSIVLSMFGLFFSLLQASCCCATSGKCGNLSQNFSVRFIVTSERGLALASPYDISSIKHKPVDSTHFSKSAQQKKKQSETTTLWLAKRKQQQNMTQKQMKIKQKNKAREWSEITKRFRS